MKKTMYAVIAALFFTTFLCCFAGCDVAKQPGGGDPVVYEGVQFAKHSFKDGWIASASAEFSGEELTIPDSYDGKKVLEISDFPELPNLKKLTVCFPAEQRTVDKNLFSSLAGLKELTLSVAEGGTLSLKSGSMPTGDAFESLYLRGGSVKAENGSFPKNTELKTLSLDSVVLDAAADSGVYHMRVTELYVRNATLNMSKYKLTEVYPTLCAQTLYLGKGGRVSAESERMYPVQCLVLEKDFSFEDGSASMLLHYGFLNSQTRYVPLASEVRIPLEITSVGARFFGADASCTVYYEGFASDFKNVTVADEGNEAWGDGLVTVLGIENTDFSVRFDTLGGTPCDSQSVRYGALATRPADPVREGYAFMGWYPSPEDGEAWDFDGDTVTADTVLYAHWQSLAEYAACEIVGSGTFELKTEGECSYYYGWAPRDAETLDISEIFTLSEYATLTVRAEHGETELPSASIPLGTGDNRFVLTVTSGNRQNQKEYALVIFRSFDCSVVFNDGTSEETVIAGVNELLEERIPTREGYTFLGWYEGERLWDFATSRVTASFALTARWEATRYKILYENTEDAVAELPESYTVEDSLIELPTPTRKGYSFLGWFSGDTPITSIEAGSIGDLTLRAEWSAETYAVIYEGVEDATHQNPSEHEFGQTVVLQDAVREGHRFLGWYEGDVRVTEISAVCAGEITLRAKWEIYTYTVTFVDLEGAQLYTETVAYGHAVKNPPVAPSIERKIFKNWSADVNFVTADVTVSPVYAEHVYSVTFDSAGGSAVEPQSVYYGEVPVKPVDPIRDGIRFEAWYLPDETVYDFTTPLDADTVLTAGWHDYVCIYKAEDFALMEGSNARFRLMNDINFHNGTFPTIGSFSGNFDGCGYTLSSFSLNGGGNLAMILENKGSVKNLNIRKASVQQARSGNDTYLALLVMYNSGIIENCHLEECSLGTTKPSSLRIGSTGLLCAKNEGQIRFCTVTEGTVELTWYYNTRYTSSYAGGETTFGGIAGWSSGTVEDCVVDISVNYVAPYLYQKKDWYNDDVSYMYIGGAVGMNGGTLKECNVSLTLSGSVSGGDARTNIRIGGLAGQLNDFSRVESCTVTSRLDVVHEGDVKDATIWIGGAIGVIGKGAQIENCAVYGRISRNSIASDANHVGGFVGWNDGNIRNCYTNMALSLGRDNRAAGFCDENAGTGTIRSCFVSGYLYAESGYVPDAFINLNSGTVADCYFLDSLYVISHAEEKAAAWDACATAVAWDSLSSLAFLTETLCWDDALWIFEQNAFPVLKGNEASAIVLATPNRYEYGSITASGTFFHEGDSVTLTANANDTFRFEGWFQKGTDILLSSDAAYTFSAKMGTVFPEARFRQDDLLVYTYEDLCKLGSYWMAGTTVYLKNSINCMGAALPMAEKFYGILDGGNYVIYNFANTVSGGEHALIRDNHGTVKNLTLSGSSAVSASSGTSAISFLTVRNHTGAVLENCHAVGVLKLEGVQKTKDYGGSITLFGGALSADNAGTIRNCTLSVPESAQIEGLATQMCFEIYLFSRLGITDGGTMSATANLYAGLIAGRNTGSIRECSNDYASMGQAEAPVQLESSLVIYNGSGFFASSSTGSCYMNAFLGGIAGISGQGSEIFACADSALMYVNDLAGTDLNSESGGLKFEGVHDGYLSSNINIGGIVGENGGTVKGSLSEGMISYTSDNINRMSCGTSGLMSGLLSTVGGIVGRNSGTVENTSYKGVMLAVSAQTTYVGGISGDNSGILSNCYGGGVIMAEGIKDSAKIYQNLKFWNGFGGNRYRHGSVSVGGMTGRNAGGATVSNCLSNYRFDALYGNGALSDRELLVNHLLLPVHVSEAFVGLFKETPAYADALQIGTVVGNAQNQGNIQNCYYVKNGEYDYTDGEMLAEDFTSLTAELIRQKLYWKIADDPAASGEYDWVSVVHGGWRDMPSYVEPIPMAAYRD